jgi:hypothetical protein
MKGRIVFVIVCAVACLMCVKALASSAKLAETLGYFADETGGVAPDFVNNPNWVLLFSSFALMIASAVLALFWKSRRKKLRLAMMIVFPLVGAALMLGSIHLDDVFQSYAKDEFGWTGPAAASMMQYN